MQILDAIPCGIFRNSKQIPKCNRQFFLHSLQIISYPHCTVKFTEAHVRGLRGLALNSSTLQFSVLHSSTNEVNYVGFHLHLSVFPFANQFNSKIGVLKMASRETIP